MSITMTIMSRRVRIFLCTVLVVVVAAIGTLWYAVSSTNRELHAALAQWQAVGGKLTLAELNESPIPEEDNAAVVYARAFVLLKNMPDEDADAIGSPSEATDLQSVVAKYREAIELANTAARMPNCCWDADYRMGIDATLPHLNQCRRLAKLLNAEAAVSTRQGDSKRAQLALESGLSLSQRLANESTVVGLLVHQAVDAIMLDALEVDFRATELPNPDSMLQCLKRRNYYDSLKQALYGDGAISIDAFDRALSQSNWLTLTVTGRLRKDETYFLQRLTQSVNTTSKPFHEIKGELEDPVPPWAVVSASWIPSLPRARSAVEHSRARIELARTAIELRKYRAAHGSYPQAWEMPIDPFTGRPMGYLRNGGILIWSDGSGPGDQIEWRWE
jgi:hypothetical protein